MNTLTYAAFSDELVKIAVVNRAIKMFRKALIAERNAGRAFKLGTEGTAWGSTKKIMGNKVRAVHGTSHALPILESGVVKPSKTGTFDSGGYWAKARGDRLYAGDEMISVPARKVIQKDVRRHRDLVQGQRHKITEPAAGTKGKLQPPEWLITKDPVPIGKGDIATINFQRRKAQGEMKRLQAAFKKTRVHQIDSRLDQLARRRGEINREAATNIARLDKGQAPLSTKGLKFPREPYEEFARMPSNKEIIDYFLGKLKLKDVLGV